MRMYLPNIEIRSTSGNSSVKPSQKSLIVVFELCHQQEQSLPGAKGVLSTIIDMIHDEFAFDGYLDDGVEDVNMGE